MLGLAEQRAWLTLAVRERGLRGLDVAELFAVAPPSENELLVPGRTVPRPSVDPPVPADDVEVVARGRLGALHLLVLLGERLDYDAGLAAASEWGSDRYLVTRSAGETCLDLTVVVAARAPGEALVRAFESWIAGRADQTVAVDGTSVSLHACGPGGSTSAATVASTGTNTTGTTTARPTSGGFGAVSARLKRWPVGIVQVARANTTTALLEQGAEPDAAACVVDSMRSQLGNDGFVEVILDETATVVVTGDAPLEVPATAEAAEQTATTPWSAAATATNGQPATATPTFSDAFAACTGFFPELASLGGATVAGS